MGKPNLPWYGDADVGSALEDVKAVVRKIETNLFDEKDILKLHNANAELIKAILSNDYKDKE